MSAERRPDWRGEAMLFVDESGVERVAIAVDHYTGAPGYYGGVSPDMFARNGFSCGARYYFGEAVAELGVEAVRPIVSVPIRDGFANVLALDEPENRHGARLDLGKHSHRLRGTWDQLVAVWQDARDRCSGGFDDPPWARRSLVAGMTQIERGLGLLLRKPASPKRDGF
ncbi:MAG: hypothetical protein ACW99F_20510, partial [Candidatus Hodarchaeales archaeon]